MSRLSRKNLLRILIILLFACLIGATVPFLAKSKVKTAVALSGSGTQADPYTISTKEELISFADSVNVNAKTYLNEYVVLTADIDLSGSVWNPVGVVAYTATTTSTSYNKYFRGHFDGQGHTISNMNVTRASTYKGLFGYTYGATLENVNFKNPVMKLATGKVAAGDYTGALVGYFVTATVSSVDYTGSIKNINVDGADIMSSGGYVGGVVGRIAAPLANDVTLENCTVTNSTVQGGGQTGGVLGYCNDASKAGSLAINRCSISNSTVNCSSYSGGLIGYLKAATSANAIKVANCTVTNVATVSSSSRVGGMIGYVEAKVTDNFAVSDCTVTGGSVYGTGYVGGMIGNVTDVSGDKGFLLERCYVKGSKSGTHTIPTRVNGSGSYTGGLIGVIGGSSTKAFTTAQDGTEAAGSYVIQCYSSATVLGTDGVGGIVGHARGVIIRQCYNSGAVGSTAGNYTGGIAGICTSGASRISNCLSTGDVSAANVVGSTASAGGVVGWVDVAGCKIDKCLVTGNVLASAASDSTGSGVAYAGGIVGYVSKASSIGLCVVASERIAGEGGTTATAVSLSSPLANCSATSTVPTPLTNTVGVTTYKNYYNKDVLLNVRQGLNPSLVNCVQGEGKSLAELKNNTIYSNLGWGNIGGVNTWARFDKANDGFPYINSLLTPETPYGSKYDPIEIETIEDFKQITTNVNTAKTGNVYAGQYLKQTKDLDFKGYATVTGTAQATSFRGNYDGGNRRIKNVDISIKKAYTGIFGYVQNASYKNVIVEKPKVYVDNTAVNHVGILVAFSGGNLYMENCAVIGGTLTAYKATGVGALCGTAYTGGNYFVKCFSSATVGGGNRVGGLVGWALGTTMTQCYCTGDVTSNLMTSGVVYAGGLVGELSHDYTATSAVYVTDPDNTATDNTNSVIFKSSVKNSFAKSNVTAVNAGSYNVAAGGVAGLASGVTEVSYCYFNGNLTATTTGGSTTSTTGAALGGIVGNSTNASVTVKSCLSAINLATASSNRLYLQAGYFNTYFGTTVVPANSEGCYYIETALPATKGDGGARNSGAKATLEKEAVTEGNPLPAVKDGSVFAAGALGWDMTGIWSQSAKVNDGFPMLNGLIIDTSELVDVINSTKIYNESNYSEQTYQNLLDVVEEAQNAISDNTITAESAQSFIEAINEAVAALRADKTALQEEYEIVMDEIAPNAKYYTNYALVETYLDLADEYLKDNTNTVTNQLVDMLYDSLVAAVKNLRVNKSELNKAIEKANAIILKADAYAPDDIKSLQSVLSEAVEVNNNAGATADEVISATKKLNNALAKMKLDKSTLSEAIIDAYKCIGVTATYSETDKKFTLVETDRLASTKLENYEAFVKALDSNANATCAVKVMQNDDATAKQITNAVFNLSVALNDLALNKKEIQELCAQADALVLNERYYSAVSITALKEAQAAANEQIKATVTKDTLIERSRALDTATDNLKAAIGALKFDKSELKTLIDQAQNELTNNSGIYTDITALQKALDDGQAVYGNAAATQKEISDAITALNNAIQNLTINLQYLKSLIDQAKNILDNDNSSLYKDLTNLTNRKTEAEKVYAECQGSSDSSKIESVKSATKLLKDAIDNLEVSNTELNNYLRKALTKSAADYVNTTDYTEASVLPFRELAQKVKDEQTAGTLTIDQIVTYTLQLRALYEALKANKDALVAYVAEVNTMTNTKYRQDNDGNWILDENNNMKVFVIYRQDSWDKLTEELKNANEVVLDTDATVEEVKTALDALKAAEKALVVDTSELAERIRKAAGLLEKTDVYTTASLNDLQAEYDKAVALIKKGETTLLTLDEVQGCYDSLVAAINGLKADISGLQSLISQAEGLISSYESYFTEASAKNLKTQLSQAKSAIDKELDSGTVLQLVESLSEAIEGLEIVTDELKALIKNFKNLDKGFITSSSYATAKSAADAAKQLLEGEFTVQQYASAINTLKNALDNVKPDRAAYKAFIDKCQQYTQSDCTAESIAALQKVIDSANALYTAAGTAITYDEIISSVDDLEAAVNALVPDKGGLAELIASTRADMAATVSDLGENVTKSDCYTYESCSALEAALKKGATVNENEVATIDEVQTAIKAIEDAVKALALDKSMLKYLIDACDRLYKEDYFEATGYAAFTSQLAQSKADYADAGITLDAYAKSYKALLDAKNALVFDTTALDKLIALAEAKLPEQARYTASSFKTLTDTLQAAKIYRDDAGKDTSQYGGVCGSLLNAISGLVDISKLSPAVDDAREFVNKGNNLSNGKYYTDGSFKELEGVLAEGIIILNGEPTQLEVDGVVEKLNNRDDLILLDVTAEKQFSNEQHTFIGRNKNKYTEETWSPYVNAVEELDELLKLTKYEVTPAEIADAVQAVKDAKDDLEEDPEYDGSSLLFELIETNATFKFIYADNTAVDFATHVYDAAKPIYLTGIALNDSVADIIAQFTNDGITAYDSKGAEITDPSQVITTGMVLKLYSGDDVVDEITLVIRGDVNGDGKINSMDQTYINQSLKGTRQLQGAYSLACDINGDGKINSMDQTYINQSLKGTRDLFAGLSVKGV